MEKKIIDLKYNDIECFNFIEKNNFLSSEFFFDNLTFWNNNNSSYISYLFVLDSFSKKLIEEIKWINEIFKLMIKFNIKYEKFYLQKEIPHIEHEINSEAWEILVKELYKKYLYKSNLN